VSRVGLRAARARSKLRRHPPSHSPGPMKQSLATTLCPTGISLRCCGGAPTPRCSFELEPPPVGLVLPSAASMDFWQSGGGYGGWESADPVQIVLAQLIVGLDLQSALALRNGLVAKSEVAVGHAVVVVHGERVRV